MDQDARTAAILLTALDSIITIDEAGHVLEFNPAAERTFGYVRSEVIGRQMADLIVPPSLRERHHRGMAHYLATGEASVLGKRIEITAMRSDGSEFPIELAITRIDAPGPAIFTAYLRDITARKALERRRGMRLAVTQILAEAPTVKDASERIIETVCTVLGWDMGQLWTIDPQRNVLRCVALWYPDEPGQEEFNHFCQALTFEIGVGLPGRIWKSRQPAWIPDVTRDGNFPRMPAASRAGLHGAFGCPIVLGSAFLGVIEFFSREVREPDADLLELMSSLAGQIGQFMERKAAEENIIELNRELLDADRRKDEFLATLAHELRNPLAPIRNGLEVLRLAQSDPEAVSQALEMMDRQMKQLVRLVDDLMDVSRISRGKIELRKETVSLASIIDLALEVSRSTIEKAGHHVQLDLPVSPVFVHVDLIRMTQVFANLLNNAAKYTPAAGRITIKACLQESNVVIRVEDTGIGITPELLPEVFTLFAQADRSLGRSQGGLGIGLTIVNSLIAMHGGTIEAQSAGIDQGSQFIVTLPVATVEGMASPPAGRRQAATASPRRRVLVIDDNVDAAESLSRVLTLLGHDVRTAFDGRAGTEAARAFLPELVLLDLGMPHLNGYETARQIRNLSTGREIRMAALTGWGQEQDRKRSREAGFDDHLIKPVDPQVLMQLLVSLGE